MENLKLTPVEMAVIRTHVDEIARHQNYMTGALNMVIKQRGLEGQYELSADLTTLRPVAGGLTAKEVEK